jgi:hypothetical protein
LAPCEGSEDVALSEFTNSSPNPGISLSKVGLNYLWSEEMFELLDRADVDGTRTEETRSTAGKRDDIMDVAPTGVGHPFPLNLGN